MKTTDVRVRRAITAMAGGHAVVLTGDPNGDGYLVFAAQAATPRLVAFAVRHTSGYLRVALPGAECERLHLPPMCDRDTTHCVSVDVRGTGTDGEGAGFGIAMSGLNGGRLNIAACSLGGAQAAFDKAGAYVRDRQAFGGSLLDEPTVRFTLADMATGLQTSRMLLWRAASALDDDDADKVELCAMAKRYVTDTCFEVADQALQLHGGYGYLREYGLEKIVRDLRVHRILEGTNEIMRLVIGRAEAARFRATV